MLVKDLYIKNDRIGRLYDCGGKCRRAVVALWNFANRMIAGIGLERVYVSFAAKQHNLFVYCGNSFEFLRLVTSNARLERNLNIISDIYCIKTAIESDSVKTDICPRNICILGSDISGSVNDIIAVFAQAYSYVFETVSISAAVIDPVCFYAAYVTRAEIGRAAGTKSAIGHNMTLLGLKLEQVDLDSNINICSLQKNANTGRIKSVFVKTFES